MTVSAACAYTGIQAGIGLIVIGIIAGFDTLSNMTIAAARHRTAGQTGIAVVAIAIIARLIAISILS